MHHILKNKNAYSDTGQWQHVEMAQAKHSAEVSTSKNTEVCERRIVVKVRSYEVESDSYYKLAQQLAKQCRASLSNLVLDESITSLLNN